MKILVTGASGFIGRVLIERISADHDVTGLVRKQNMVTTSLGIKILVGDIRTFKTKKEYDIIFHLSGCLDDPFVEKSMFNDINVNGTANLLSNVKFKKFIFISSSGVYGKCSNADESSKLMPGTPYEISKHLAEQAVINSGIDYLIFRPCLVYGRNEKRLKKFIRLINFGLVPIIGDGSNNIQIISVETLADILAKSLQLNYSKEIFNVCGEIITIESLIRKINPKAVIIKIPKNAGLAYLNLIEKTKLNFLELVLNQSRFNFFTETRTYSNSKLKKYFKFHEINFGETFNATPGKKVGTQGFETQTH